MLLIPTIAQAVISHKGNVFYLHGGFNQTSADELTKFVQEAKAYDYSEIHIRINSPGGAVTALNQMLVALSSYKGKVITHNDGVAASCGFLLFLEGDERIGYRYSLYMSHGSAMSMVAGGNKEYLEDTVRMLKTIDTMGEDLLKSMGVSEADIKEHFYNGRNNFIGTLDMQKFGLITEFRK